MSAPHVIGVFGISGVGKTRLIRDAIADLGGLLHLQASALIKQGLTDTAVDSEALRQSPRDRVLANQRVLVAMFAGAVAATQAKLVILDGHLLIDTNADAVDIPFEVIAAVAPGTMVHVEAAPGDVANRRQQDLARTRPQRTVAVLAQHQLRSRDLCHQYAWSLGMNVHTIAAGLPEALRSMCVRLLTER